MCSIDLPINVAHSLLLLCFVVQLLPGDLVSITRSKGDAVCPCDILLLSGSVVANEALLTGESTPQLKVALLFSTSFSCIGVMIKSIAYI
jgi:P-type E1-E2 ATPase